MKFGQRKFRTAAILAIVFVASQAVWAGSMPQSLSPGLGSLGLQMGLGWFGWLLG